jgi:hypothetical protein
MTEGRILPAEREQVIRQHMQAGHDDEFVGTASFSEGATRVSQFEEWIPGRPKHGMDAEATQEALREAAAVFNNNNHVHPGFAQLAQCERRSPVDTGAQSPTCSTWRSPARSVTKKPCLLPRR